MEYKKYIGQRRGTFLVISEADKIGQSRAWVCQCSCGNKKNVTSGNIKRCKYILCPKCGSPNIAHQRFYQTWIGMIGRCHKNGNRDYKYWGARGISVCNKWRNDYYSFHNWAEKNWKEGCSLDRIDNSMPYSPNNCKYSTPKEQANNRRNNRPITLNGVTKNLTQWCSYYNIPRTLVVSREKRGWLIKDALTKPKHNAII
jgi:hypothetical protein